MNDRLIIRWVWIAGAAALILLAVLSPVMCRHRKAPPPAVLPTRSVALHAQAPIPALRAKPSAAKVPAPVISNAVPTPAPAAVAAPASVRVASATLAEQKRELDSAVVALVESKARMMLVDAKVKLGAGDIDGADRVLTELLWLRPDFTTALALRARLLEQQGRTVEARKQWTALTADTNTALAEQALAEVRRIDAEREPPPALVSTSAPAAPPTDLPNPASVPAEIEEPAPTATVIPEPAPAPPAVVSGP